MVNNVYELFPRIDGRLSVEELLDVTNAGDLGLGDVLQSALPALGAAAGGPRVSTARTWSPGRSGSWTFLHQRYPQFGSNITTSDSCSPELTTVNNFHR